METHEQLDKLTMLDMCPIH